MRTARGRDVLDKAKELLSMARTVDELRQAQAVILPLELGLTLSQTAAVIGVSKSWTSRLRTEFILAGGKIANGKSYANRRRENMSRDEEVKFLAPFIEKAKSGCPLIVREVKEALQEQLGRTIALTSVYNLLHRHDWRNFVPEKRHLRSGISAREDVQKNSSLSLRKSKNRDRGEEVSTV